MKTIKTTLSIVFLALLLIGNINAQSCASGVVTFGGSSFISSNQPLCPSPNCESITWEVDLDEINEPGRTRFERIELTYDGTTCSGAPMPFNSPAEMGSMSAAWTGTGRVRARIFVEMCLDNEPCQDLGNWSSPRLFCTSSSDEVEVLGDFIGEGTVTRDLVIGATDRTFNLDQIDLDFFDVSNLNSVFEWSVENVSPGGNIEITSTTGDDSSVSATLSIDECSDGDLVATATDKCGRTIEYIRIRIRRFCPTLNITGPSGCDAVWCGDPNESFTYTVDASINSGATLAYTVSFPSNMELLSVSQGVTISSTGAWTVLSSAESFTFTIKPPFVNNTYHPIVINLMACPGTTNACDQTETLYIYSGVANAIDLNLQVYGSSSWDRYKLCKYQNNYVQAFFDGVSDPCILEWEWSVPNGWQIFYPNNPDKEVALIIPNSNYGTVYIRTRSKCGWSDWIGYGFSVSKNCKKGYYTNAPQDLSQTPSDKTDESMNLEGLHTQLEAPATHHVVEDVLIFPNPIKGGAPLNIETALYEEEAPLHIFNAQGMLVYSTKLQSQTGRHQLQMGTLVPGIYMIQIGSEKNISYQRLSVTD